MFINLMRFHVCSAKTNFEAIEICSELYDWFGYKPQEKNEFIMMSKEKSNLAPKIR